jgi:hypothetical protein
MPVTGCFAGLQNFHSLLYKVKLHPAPHALRAKNTALSRYEVQNELHYVDSIHNAAKMKPTAS